MVYSSIKMNGKDIKNLNEISKEEQRKFIDSFDRALFDCDGVIWTLGGFIDGAGETLTELSNAGKKLAFVSNNSTNTFEICGEKFDKIGYKVTKDQLLNPAVAIIHYLKSINFDKKVFALVCEQFKSELELAGFEVVSQHDGAIPNIFGKVMQFLKMDKDIGAVILDLDLNTTLLAHENALCLLFNPDVKFIVGATDKELPVAGMKKNLLGPGYAMESMSKVSGRKPLVFGKPGKEFSDCMKELYHIKDPKRILFVGDMLEQDMGFGTVSGFQKLLVLSGGSSIEDLKNCTDPNLLPDYYIQSIKDLLPLLNSI